MPRRGLYSEYQASNSFEVRKMEADSKRERHPDLVPVIVEKPIHSEAPSLRKKKYLVHPDCTLASFQHLLRSKLQLEASQALYLFINRQIPLLTSTIGDIYLKMLDADGFLYIMYELENVFGSDDANKILVGMQNVFGEDDDAADGQSHTLR